MFVVGSGVDVASVKEHLQDLVEHPGQRARGVRAWRWPAAPRSRRPARPIFDATTVGLAYSQDPDGATAGNDVPRPGRRRHPDAAAVGCRRAVDDDDFADFADAPAEEGRKPFLLVGSALTSIFVIGVVALVISLAVSIRPTADQRPDAGQAAIVPSALPPAAPAPRRRRPPPAAAAAAALPPETIKAPMPVVQQAPRPQAPPRTVYVDQPRRAAAAAAPRFPSPPPAAPPPPGSGPPRSRPPPVVHAAASASADLPPPCAATRSGRSQQYPAVSAAAVPAAAGAAVPAAAAPVRRSIRPATPRGPGRRPWQLGGDGGSAVARRPGGGGSTAAAVAAVAAS